MVRACHRDTCPTGIATQRPNLRAKFAGTPERWSRRTCCSSRRRCAGCSRRSGSGRSTRRSGASSCSRQRTTGNERADSLDLRPLLAPLGRPDAPRRFVATVPIQRPRSTLDERLLADGVPPAVGRRRRRARVRDHQRRPHGRRVARRRDRARVGRAACRPGPSRSRFTGAAGQSFGAFLADGVTLDLIGEANDYVGKGMGGGRIVIVRPPRTTPAIPCSRATRVLYGATGGQLFVAGPRRRAVLRPQQRRDAPSSRAPATTRAST